MTDERDKDIEDIAVAKLIYGMAAEVEEEAKRNLYQTILGSGLTRQEKAHALGRCKDTVHNLMRDYQKGKFDSEVHEDETRGT